MVTYLVPTTIIHECLTINVHAQRVIVVVLSVCLSVMLGFGDY